MPATSPPDPIEPGGFTPLPPTPPTPPAPKRPVRTVLPWVCVALVIAAAVKIALALRKDTRQLAANLTQERSKTQILDRTIRQLHDQVESLHEEQVKLQQARQALTSDRDNVLAALKLAQDDTQQATSTRDVLEQTTKRLILDNQALNRRLDPLERHYAQLEHAYEQALEELSGLRRQRNELQQRLKRHAHGPGDALAKERQAHRQDAAALRRAQREVKQLHTQQASIQTHMEQVEHRIAALKEQYTAILAENTTLRHQAIEVPVKISRMAHQHERLVKETADMHYNLGVLFTNRKEYHHAAAEFAKVVELRPDDADAYYNLGVIYAEHVPDRGKSLLYFRRYIELNPRARDASWVKQYIASWQAWEAKERLE